ncbi:MAG: lmo0937 family membrane protein [Myxococcales bacterium]|jgi:hypothetical protein|nr:lmo0937 family membrane protein [Myxococcales bacterium]HRC56424.1 lmo0937 family membrane protein [Kofleriaceae bacterium]
MLWTIAIIFLLLWALGLATSYTLGGYLHVLVGVATVLLLIRIMKASGRGHTRKPTAAAGNAGP